MSAETNSGMERISGSIRKASTVVRQREWSFFLPAILVLYSVIKEIKVGEPFMYKYQTEFLHYNATTLNGEVRVF